MKLLKKALAVAMSLSLCVGMVAPAFAATFADLQNAISGDNDSDSNLIGTIDGHEHYGYGEEVEAEDGTKTWEIEAWNTKGEALEGYEPPVRSIQLNSTVTYSGSDEEPKSITINGSVNLDLNGSNIEGAGSDPVIDVYGNLDVTGEGTITGGGIGIKVNTNGSLSVGDKVSFSENTTDVFLDSDPTTSPDPSGDGYTYQGATLKGGKWDVTNGSEPIDEGKYTVTESDGSKVVSSAKAKQDLCLMQKVPTDPETPETPETPTDPENPEESMEQYDFIGSGDTAEAEDTMTGAEVVNYIWEHEGKPEPASDVPVPSGQKYAASIAWARSINLIDDEVQLDELMTVSRMRAILTRFAAWKGIEMPELAALTGKEEDPVRNCLEVLKEFFGEE